MEIAAVKHFILQVMRLVLGDDNTKVLLLKRNFYYYKKIGIIFIHVPKNAGSSISYALYGRSLGHMTAIDMQCFDRDTFESLLSFAVLRDPLDRARSAWGFCRSAGSKEGWVNDRPEYHSGSFSTFDRFANEWLPTQDPSDLDVIFRPQSDFICNKNGEVLVSRLIDLRQLPIIWPAMIKGRPVSHPALKVRNFNERRPAVSLEEMQAAEEGIKRFYAVDYSLYSKVTKSSVSE